MGPGGQVRKTGRDQGSTNATAYRASDWKYPVEWKSNWLEGAVKVSWCFWGRGTVKKIGILGELGKKLEIKGDYDKVLNFRELAPRPLPRIRKNRPSKSELVSQKFSFQ